MCGVVWGEDPGSGRCAHSWGIFGPCGPEGVDGLGGVHARKARFHPVGPRGGPRQERRRVKGSERWGTKWNERQGPEQGLFLFSLQRTQGSAGKSNHISTTKDTKGTRESKENDAFGKSIVHGSLAGETCSHLSCFSSVLSASCGDFDYMTHCIFEGFSRSLT